MIMSSPLSHIDTWINAVQTKDPDKVVSLYAADAVLIPTVSNQIRYTQDERRDYFVHFLAKGPRCTVDSSHIQQLSDNAITVSGIYTFVFEDRSQVSARFTFIFGQDGTISHHHSSLLPE